MRPTIVSGMVAGDALISYWLVFSFSLLLLTVPEAFARANSTQSFSRIWSQCQWFHRLTGYKLNELMMASHEIQVESRRRATALRY